jgi:hypothetical protein
LDELHSIPCVRNYIHVARASGVPWGERSLADVAAETGCTFSPAQYAGEIIYRAIEDALLAQEAADLGCT